MRRLFRSRGDSKLGCLIWLAALGFIAYVGLQAIPAKMKAAELQEFMERQAEGAYDARMESIKAAVLARARELELPVDKKAVSAERRGGRVRINYSYSIPLNLVVKTHDWAFDITVDRPVFPL